MNSSNAFRIRRFLFRSYSFGIETLGPNSDLPSIASLVINLKGVEQQLRSLIEDKAAGPGQLYPWLLKMAATEIAPVLKECKRLCETAPHPAQGKLHLVLGPLLFILYFSNSLIIH